jgi:hypothetical protein
LYCDHATHEQFHSAFKAERMIHHAERWVLGLGQSDPSFAVFERHYAQLRAA